MTEQIIQTERLVLRPLALSDVEDFAALHADPEVLRFLGPPAGGPQVRLAAAEREWAERGHGSFAILERRSGRFLGRAGLRYWPQFDETEAGWALRRDAWGHGYATEAARAFVGWGFGRLPVSYFTAMIMPRNVRSIRVAERLGFAPLRGDILLGNDVLVYALTRERWAGPEVPPGGASN